ncbi:lipoprotein [Nitrospira sp.]|nr:lipoprotein [Nitrospira sp.]
MTIMILALLTWGCQKPTVRTDFDSVADFTAFRTYAFAAFTDPDEGSVLNDSEIRRRLESMLHEQLSMKGLTRVEAGVHPDLLVHYWVGMKKKHAGESTAPTGGFYGWRSGYAQGVGDGGLRTYAYTEGTLIVDLVSRFRNELVWRGIIFGPLTGSREKKLQLTNEGIAMAFENYPPRTNTP